MTAFEKMDYFGGQRRPFIFIVDYELQNPYVVALDEITTDDLLYDFRGKTNAAAIGFQPPESEPAGIVSIHPPAYPLYRAAFQIAKQSFVDGNSDLLNLCAASNIVWRGRLDGLFSQVRAPYRLRKRGLPGQPDFLVFSPESFMRIEDGCITAFPMKGSLKCRPSQLEAARRHLMDDAKELAEHITIVDLIRNDLGRVADSVTVRRFRYLEEVRLAESILLQTSSEITGNLMPDWPDHLGGLFAELLPAGSITGAPKSSTCRIIARAEQNLGGPRGVYTGICGIFDGISVDSAVMIRFLEDHGALADDANLRKGVFRSGGGLTIYSRPQSEYRELLAKVALPIPPLLMETVRIEGGMAMNLAEHQKRVTASLLACYGAAEAAWSLDAQLSAALAEVGRRGGAGRWRWRMVYSDFSADWTVEPYTIRRPQCLYLVDATELEYSHKYADRQALADLRQKAATKIGDIGMDWDILLTRNGLLLETSYTAIVVQTATGLLTPAAPILPSTRIAALLAGGKHDIQRADIAISDLPDIQCVYLINAMIGLEDAVIVADIRV